MRQPGGALVGVGRTSSVVLPTVEDYLGGPVLTVLGAGSVVYALQTVGVWHLPTAWALDWRASSGIWRQGHCYRVCYVGTIHPTPVVGPSCAGFPTTNATSLDRPLSVVSGGGAFYSFYTEDFRFQTPKYRQILVNGSRAGLRFYNLNPEHGTGDAQSEIAHSTNVSVYGLKSERNFAVLWVRNSSNVLVTGFGGHATAFPTDEGYPPGYI